MILLVGLGNPGPQHQHQRHNVGFLAIDEIRRQHGFRAERNRFQGLLAEGNVITPSGSQKIFTLKPTTYMNESGRSVGEAVRFYKIPLSHVIVFHDEVDLVPGKVRVKQGGGTAGHNGLRSLQAHLGPDFRRVRIGIGHPGHKDAVARYALHDFTKAEKHWLDPLLDEMAKAIPLLASGEDSAFMNRVHLATQPPKEKEPETEPKKTENQRRARRFVDRVGDVTSRVTRVVKKIIPPKE